jgi:hypothetical protein
MQKVLKGKRKGTVKGKPTNTKATKTPAKAAKRELKQFTFSIKNKFAPKKDDKKKDQKKKDDKKKDAKKDQKKNTPPK